MRVWNPPPQSLLESSPSITITSDIHKSPHFVYEGPSNTAFACQPHLIIDTLALSYLLRTKTVGSLELIPLRIRLDFANLPNIRSSFLFGFCCRNAVPAAQGPKRANPYDHGVNLYTRETRDKPINRYFLLTLKKKSHFHWKSISDQHDQHETGADPTWVIIYFEAELSCNDSQPHNITLNLTLSFFARGILRLACESLESYYIMRLS